MNFNMVLLGAIRGCILNACCVAVLLFLVGCGPLKDATNIDRSCEPPPSVEGAANVSLFMSVNRHGGRANLIVKISSIELLVDDLWVPVSSDVLEINSKEAISTQWFLGRQWLKGANCRGVRLKVAGATLTGVTGDREISIINPEAEFMLQAPFELVAGTRKVLLLEWDPEKSLSSVGFERMFLKASLGGVARITANLVYVACPDIDTVYVVAVDKFQVVDAFTVTGNPAYLAVDSDKRKIHILATALNKITPYDISTHLPGSDIEIPMANAPIFMAVNNRSLTAYVLDAQGVLTSIDLVSGDMLHRNRVGNRPNYLYYILGLEKLAVSSTIDQTVYLVNPDSLEIEESISLGSPPLGLVSWENFLYIAEGTANTVSVYDLSARKMLKDIRVGFEPSRFVANDSSVYVANFLDGTISVMQGGQLNVSKEVSVGKSAREMGLAEKNRLLFVGEGDCDGSLAVVDTNGNHVIGRIELGTMPMGIAVVE